MIRSVIGVVLFLVLVGIGLFPLQKILFKNATLGTATTSPVPKKDVYIIVLVGDSMTAVLGPHGGLLSEKLNTLYGSAPGNQRIVVDNYAQGSTNILKLTTNYMQQQTLIGDIAFEPLASRDFDLILIESFGYNPLSQFKKDEGLKKQTQALDHLVKRLKETHPHAAIVFVATIAPNKETFAQEVQNKSTTETKQQAEERAEYIKNHIAYAKKHQIPLIDLYHKSLTLDGDGDMSYINSQDDIHPSTKGVELISDEIANFIYDNQILPK